MLFLCFCMSSLCIYGLQKGLDLWPYTLKPSCSSCTAQTGMATASWHSLAADPGTAELEQGGSGRCAPSAPSSGRRISPWGHSIQPTVPHLQRFHPQGHHETCEQRLTRLLEMLPLGHSHRCISLPAFQGLLVLITFQLPKALFPAKP